MFRFHVLLVAPSKVCNAQLNNPSSAVDTLKITRVAFWATQLMLNLQVKATSTPDTPVDGTIVPALAPSNLRFTAIRLSSNVRLNYQRKLTLVDPLRSCVLFLWTILWSDTVSTGGGSNQVTLPTASEIVNIILYWNYCFRMGTCCKLLSLEKSVCRAVLVQSVYWRAYNCYVTYWTMTNKPNLLLAETRI